MILLMCYKSYVHERCLLLCGIFKKKIYASLQKQGRLVKKYKGGSQTFIQI